MTEKKQTIKKKNPEAWLYQVKLGNQEVISQGNEALINIRSNFQHKAAELSGSWRCEHEGSRGAEKRTLPEQKTQSIA